jgi:pyridoxine/pyridoxamine 5'-phosphate oxidase
MAPAPACGGRSFAGEVDRGDSASRSSLACAYFCTFLRKEDVGSKTSSQIRTIKVEAEISHRANEITMFPATETMTPTYVGGMPIMS